MALPRITPCSPQHGVSDDPLWHNWAPRMSLAYDLTGKGKEALKFSAGRYLDQINTGNAAEPERLDQ